MLKQTCKYVLFILLTLCCTLSLATSWSSEIQLTKQEKDFLKEHPVIRVHSEQDWYPFNFIENGEFKGLSSELIELLAEKLGVQVEYVQGSGWADFLDMMGNHKLDVLTNIVKTRERSKNILFTRPFLQLVPSIASPKSAPLTTIEQLKGKNVALIRGHWYQSIIEEKYPDIRLLLVQTNKDAFLALDQNKVDAVISLDIPMQHLINSHPFPKLAITGVIEADGVSSQAVRIGIRRDWPLLSSALDKALVAVDDQQRARLMTKWIGDEEVYKNALESTSGFTLAEKAYLTNKGPLKFCVDPTWQPVESIDEDGNYVGISAQLLHTMSQRTGIDMELVPTTSWASSLTYAKNRECDFLSLAMTTPERSAYLDFTSPYIFVPIVIATSQAEVFITDLAVIIDKPIGIVKGYVLKDVIKKHYPEANLVEVENIYHGLEMVEEQELFGYIDSLSTIALGIQQKGFENVKVSGQLAQTWDLSIATRNDEPILRDIMEKAVKTLSQAEKMIEANFWYSVELKPSVDYTLIWKISGVSVLILSLIIIWNRMLAKAGKKTLIALDELSKTQEELQKAYALMEKIAVTDRLTQLFNRTKLDEALDQERNRSIRYGNSLSIILIDIDRFKQVNDTHGHQVGDQVLIEIAQILKNRSRRTDTVGRWGGEEFLIICPQTDEQGVSTQMGKLRQIIASHYIPVVGHKTVSLGATTLRENETVESFIARADKAMYSAKKQGRNKGVLF